MAGEPGRIASVSESMSLSTVSWPDFACAPELDWLERAIRFRHSFNGDQYRRDGYAFVKDGFATAFGGASEMRP